MFRRGYTGFAILLLISSISAHAAEIGWSGFGSAYYGQALSSDLMPATFSSTHVNFTGFSLVGLNLSANVNSDLTFASQLVALGSSIGSTDSFGLLAQWAYVNYTPFQGFLLKAGRQLFPMFIASEYIRVGYLLPYRQIPFPVFDNAPFARFDGVSIYETVDVGLGKLTAGLFGGTPLLDTNTATRASAGLTLQIDDLLGAQVSLDGDGWRVRAAVARVTSKTTVAPPISQDFQGHVQVYSTGYRFDKYNIVSWGEYSIQRTPDGTLIPPAGNRYLDISHGYYVLGGYRIGKFLPRYMFAQGSQAWGFAPNGKATTHTFGLNYEAGAQAVIKADYEIDAVPSAGAGGVYVKQTNRTSATSGSAFTVGVDLIF